ncbi:hypothetical protein ILUMI_17569 [Ignelater luminosus]|uniref:Reverse transcriptase domain-containing protein n=1 Tax=Ignelater luminosus TaxID=2038154 RepID=A0A8K0CJW2_IGNLU|nr:hypothetical protein ILUMI_17569 [Ignelater luminosus]
MLEIYYPGKSLLLDESMVLWRESLQVREYIKSKRHKYGAKTRSVEKAKLTEINTKLDKILENDATGKTRLTYAQTAKVPKNPVVMGKREVRPKFKIVIEPANGNEKIKTSDDTKAEILKAVNPRAHALRVVDNDHLKKAGLTARKHVKLNPRMAIYGVPSRITKEELESVLIEQNSPESGKWQTKDIKVLFKFGQRNKSTGKSTWTCYAITSKTTSESGNASDAKTMDTWRKTVRERPLVANVQVNLQNNRMATLQLQETLTQMKADIVLLQEPYTYLNKSKNQRQIPGIGKTYQCLMVKTQEQIQAAIIIADPNLDVLLHAKLTTPTLVVTTIKLRGLAIRVVNAYCPPSQEIEPHLNQIRYSIQHQRVFLAGDFNAKATVWHNPQTDVRGDAVLEFLPQEDLICINRPNNPPTFRSLNGESNIDLTITSSMVEKYIQTWEVKADEIDSDHNIIVSDLSLDHRKYVTKRSNYNLSNINVPELTRQTENPINELERRLWEPTIAHIDERVEALTGGLQRIMEEVLHKRTQYVGKPEWWNDTLERARKQAQNARRLAQRANGTPDHQILRERYRTAKETLKRKIEEVRHKSWATFVSTEISNNPWGTIYKLAASKIKYKTAQTTIRTGRRYTSEHLDSLQAVLQQKFPDDDELTDTPTHREMRQQAQTVQGNPEIDTEITEEEVIQAIATIKEKKAPGWDGIHGIILKILAPTLFNYLRQLYNDCLTMGYFPAAWKKGKLVTILKAPDKDPTDAKSLRPITFLPELGKVFERLIRKSILDQVGEQNILHRRQFGFRAKHSAEQAIEQLIHDIQNNDNKYVAILSVNISGAFDNLWWPTTILRTHEMALSSKIVQIIRNYLDDRQITYNTGNETATRQLTKGCPQGSILGPTLWNLAVDSLLEIHIDHSTLLAYADDIVAVVGASNRRDLETRMAGLTTALEEWTTTQNLETSAQKTVYMMVGRSHLRRNPTVRLNGQLVSRVTQLKYLGVHIDAKLLFDLHIRQTSTRAKNILQILRQQVKKKWGSPPASLRTIYNHAIVPILRYGITVWGSRIHTCRNKRVLQSLHGLATRTITGAYNSVSAEAAQTLAGYTALHQLLEKKLALARIRTTGAADFMGTQFTREEFPRPKLRRQRLREESLPHQQEEWKDTTKGATTHWFFPDISILWGRTISLPSETVSMLTGHGDFQKHLHRTGKADHPYFQHCPQDAADDPIHRLYGCLAYQPLRHQMLQLIPDWPIPPEELGQLVIEEGVIAEMVAAFEHNIPTR